MAHKITVTRSALVDGQELSEAAAAIFAAYEEDGRMLSAEVSEDGMVIELWFETTEVADQYLAEMAAVEGPKVDGAEVASVERVDADWPLA